MKKNSGFTLVELLAVIVILGILISISSVAVNSLRKKQENKNMENVISSILTGAKEYNAEKRIPVGDEGVSVSDLIDGNYTDFDTKKYANLFNTKKVTKQQCEDNKLKIKYSIEVDDTTYNDCGCEKQVTGNNIDSDEICTN